MLDTLSNQQNGIPDIGIRLTILVVATVVLLVGVLLIWMKMKESDDRAVLRQDPNVR